MKYKKYSLYLLAAVIATSSCKKQLEQNSPGDITDASAFQTFDNVQMGTNGDFARCPRTPSARHETPAGPTQTLRQIAVDIEHTAAFRLARELHGPVSIMQGLTRAQAPRSVGALWTECAPARTVPQPSVACRCAIEERAALSVALRARG